MPDGRSFMNTLGGAGTHTLVGMRPWSDRLGFVAYRGHDLDPQHEHFLMQLGIDLRGVILRAESRTARAWQLFEPDERRIEIFRTSFDDFVQSKPGFEEIPADYLEARGFHLQWGSSADQAYLIKQIRASNPQARFICEPSIIDIDTALEANLSVLQQVDLFSPDREEAYKLVGSSDIPSIFERLLSAGARCIALRMGAAGSLVGSTQGEFYRVPAVPPAQLVDTTGAGNAYCGGFIVGLGRGEELAIAAARAAASASFAIEQIGVPAFNDEKIVEAQRRFEWALERIQVADI